MLAMAANRGLRNALFSRRLARLVPSMKAGHKSGRRVGDSRVSRSFNCWLLVLVGGIATSIVGGRLTHGQPPQGGNGGPADGQPVYQRQGFDRSHDGRDRRRDDFRQSNRFGAPQFNSGWFQRPYPTHLDYFRLRSGEAPPRYYGDWYGAAYGGWVPGGGSWGPQDGLYPPQETSDETDGQGVSPRALMLKTPLQQKATKDSSEGARQDKSSSESLPPPKVDK
jgi:hypothetical protein